MSKHGINVFYNRAAPYELEKVYGRDVTQSVLAYMRSVGLGKREKRGGYMVETFPVNVFATIAAYEEWKRTAAPDRAQE